MGGLVGGEGWCWWRASMCKGRGERTRLTQKGKGVKCQQKGHIYEKRETVRLRGEDVTRKRG